MKGVLNSDSIPKMEKTCEKCAYLEGWKRILKQNLLSTFSPNLI